MYFIIVLVLVIVCILLILSVLIQNSKGGLSSGIAGISAAQQMIGAVRSADLIEKITWYLAGSIVVLIILSNIFVDKSQSTSDLRMGKQLESQQIVTMPTNSPNMNKLQKEESTTNPNE